MALDRKDIIWTFIEEPETEATHPIFTGHRFDSRQEAIEFKQKNNIPYEVGQYYDDCNWYWAAENEQNIHEWITTNSSYFNRYCDWQHSKWTNKNKSTRRASRLFKSDENVQGYQSYVKNVFYGTHFSRVSETQPGKIAIIESPEKGMQNLYTIMTPGRYLKKYFDDVFSSEEIEYLANSFEELYGDNDWSIQWADDPDEWEMVYSMEASFESCMQYESCHWEHGIHPCRAYGAGDLRLAYLTDNDGDRLLARAIVWPDKNKVGRVYGNGVALRKALFKEGIETDSNSFDYDYMTGAKLLRIVYDEYDDNDEDKILVLPYVDGTPRAHINDDYVVIGSGDGSRCCLDLTDAWFPIEATFICEMTGEEEVVSLRRYVVMEKDGDALAVGRLWYNNNKIIYCHITEQYYKASEFTKEEYLARWGWMTTVTGNVDENKVYTCTGYNQPCYEPFNHKREHPITGEIICSRYFIHEFRKCSFDEKWYPRAEVKEKYINGGYYMIHENNMEAAISRWDKNIDKQPGKIYGTIPVNPDNYQLIGDRPMFTEETVYQAMGNGWYQVTSNVGDQTNPYVQTSYVRSNTTEGDE